MASDAGNDIGESSLTFDERRRHRSILRSARALASSANIVDEPKRREASLALLPERCRVNISRALAALAAAARLSELMMSIRRSLRRYGERARRRPPAQCQNFGGLLASKLFDLFETLPGGVIDLSLSMRSTD